MAEKHQAAIAAPSAQSDTSSDAEESSDGGYEIDADNSDLDFVPPSDASHYDHDAPSSDDESDNGKKKSNKIEKRRKSSDAKKSKKGKGRRGQTDEQENKKKKNKKGKNGDEEKDKKGKHKGNAEDELELHGG